jgi:hypothetical protein
MPVVGVNPSLEFRYLAIPLGIIFYTFHFPCFLIIPLIS